MYVIGQPGTGKSRAVESWVLQDVRAGHGVGVIDPHGDLFHNLLIRLSFIPEVWERILIIDPCSRKWVTSFNPLEPVQGLSKERLALFLTDIVGKIWQLDTTSAPRTIWLLSNSFLALTDLGLTLLDLARFLLDCDYRQNLLPRLTHSMTQAYFQNEYPSSPGGSQQWATPVLNKIGGLIFDPDTSLLIAGRSKFTFRDVLDRKLILLVNLPKGIIGEGASALMGAFIVAHIQKAALARADSQQRSPFYLYLDEFQNYTTDNIKDILSESRKYSLSLTLVHQYLDQLTPDLQSAVLNTAGSIVSFRIGYQDGRHLAKEIFSNSDFQSSHFGSVRINPSRLWPSFTFNNSNSNRDEFEQLLTKLQQREFWYKRRGLQPASKHKTIPMPIPLITYEVRENINALVDTAGRNFGRYKKDVQAEVSKGRYTQQKDTIIGDNNPRSPHEDDTPSFWGV